jgi:hypothetical protein
MRWNLCGSYDCIADMAAILRISSLLKQRGVKRQPPNPKYLGLTRLLQATFSRDCSMGDLGACQISDCSR